MERYTPNINTGLTQEQVNYRVKEKLVNVDNTLPTKSYKQIAFTNIFTLFNIINLFLGIIVIMTGRFKNLPFLGVAFFNTIISMIQEMRSKHTIDKLSLISKTKVNVLRDSKDEFIDIEDIVLDDIIKYKLGDQIVVDSIIKEGLVEVNESFLTGESDSILKRPGDKLLSGSFVVSGSCISQVDSVGLDSYANKITSEAKYLKKVNSEIMLTLNKIIKIISILIIPLGTILYIRQLGIADTRNEAIISTVAAIIGTIPEGLVLLTSTVLAVSSIRLSKKQVLVQQLYCIENLARVDIICLDKTGTLTTGNMKIVKTISLNNYDIDSIMSKISKYMDDGNSTSNCINDYYKSNSDDKLVNKINFSSDKKYSVYEFKDNTYIVGAYEFINYNEYIDNLKEYENEYRVLSVGVSKSHIVDNKIEGTFTPVGLILIEDEIRTGAKDTLEYLKREDVNIKIISGDNVKTVSNIAKKVGLKDIKIYDANNLTKDNIDTVVEEYDIFGRVTPSQKKEIVLSLKRLGHKVAMTGDGVNDVLSLKEADCSIALASSSSAARNVSELVLLNSDFKEIPSIIKEGRRTINNLERSASLFLTKTIYATLIAILFVFVNMDYPFIPIQLTLISVITIGIPSFVLALEPNKNRVKGHFIVNVFSKSLPAALTIVINIISIIILSSMFNIDSEYVSTMSVILVAFTGFVLLFKVCYPFNYVRGALFGTLIAIFIGSSFGLHKLFELILLTPLHFIFIIILCALDIIVFTVLTLLCNKFISKNEKRLL